ncbi:MAG: TonB-dependent receptor [Novosphingobium sp.]
MRKELYLASFAAIAWASLAAPAVAQDAPASPAATSGEVADGSDIIVTARRRNETTLQTPVVLTAFSAEKLDSLHVTSVTDVAKLTPMLIIAPATGPYGGNLTLRGVASPSSNAASEPAVTINIDGVPLSFGGVVRMATMDVGQIEVLKGPQALFFGKNSTGGIVSIRTAEPTSTFQSQFSAAYEFHAHQVDLDGFVSGPVSDTLSLRAAGKFTRQRGYFKNVAPTPGFDYGPGTAEEGFRLSANWKPTERLTVKLRGTYDNVHEHGTDATSQKIACSGPLGAPQGFTGAEDCTLNNTMASAPIPSAAIRAKTGNLDWDSDTPYLRVKQHLITADISYQLTDSISLNSVTGWYGINQRAVDPGTTGAKFFIGTLANIRKNSFSQEARLTFRSPDSPIDLMFGGFYQSDHLLDREQVVGVGLAGPGVITPFSAYWTFPLNSKAISAFGQMDWNITQQLSLSTGVRYSQDSKYHNIVSPAPLTATFTAQKVTFSNWSPEATLAFKPNEDTNFFVSYKQGYKSGAFSIGATNYTGSEVAPIDPSYNPETVQGFEGGVKARLFDHQLRLNLSAYSYKYKNLQLSRLDPVTTALIILSASSARVKGLEGDVSFSPRSVPGLTINGAAALNSAKYDSSFVGGCYVGQTFAGGCSLVVNGKAQQQFQGRTLPRAPKFSASGGFSYETAVGGNLKTKFNLNGIYTSKYFLSQELNPIGIASNRFLLDGSISVGSESGGYEFSLIGRNLTDRNYPYSGFQTPFTGGGTGTAVGQLPDFEGPISRGREIWLKVTIRPGAL